MAASVCRLAVLASHPIQYFTPLYRLLAQEPGVELEVMFYRDFGSRRRFDKQFGRAIRWDTDQLAGYRHRFLRNVSPVADTFNPLHAINPGAFVRLLRGFDALWLNGYMYPSNWLAAAGAALGRTKVLFRSELLPSRPSRRVIGPVRDAVIRAWVRRSDALLYIGDANRRAYLAYGARPEQLFFSPYSVDVDRIAAVRARQTANRDELRRKWNVPTDRTVLLFVGKLIPLKHAEVMLDLAAELGPAVHAVVVGSGPLEAELRAAAEQRRISNVSFVGFVNQAALPEVYALADVFVLASDREQWGLVLNEAMAAGLAPVVSDAVGACADLITPGETGYVFPSLRWDELLRAVRPLVMDHALRARVGAAAQRRAARYSYRASVDGILQALEAVGARRAARVPRAMAGAR